MVFALRTISILPRTCECYGRTVGPAKQHEPHTAKHPDIDPRFLFINLGYNLRATELQGAMGSVQLPKLAGFVGIRRDNADAWRRSLARWSEYFDMQQETPQDAVPGSASRS